MFQLGNLSVSLPIILLQLLIHSSVPSQSIPIFVKSLCYDNGNYTQNSIYQENLGLLLDDLTAKSAKTGYYNATSGESSDKVYCLYYCRADVDSSLCHDCVQVAAKTIVRDCNELKEAIIWYEECTLRYANRFFFSQVEDFPWVASYTRINESDDSSQLDLMLTATINGLIKKAAYDGAYHGFATKEAPFLPGQPLYCLVQCVPGIQGLPCDSCLSVAYREIQHWGYVGVRMFLPNCQVMYDTVPFYKALSEPPASPPSVGPPEPPTSPEHKGIGYYIIRIGVPGAGFMMLLFAVAVYLLVYRKSHKKTVIKDTDSADALQFDIGTIKTATSNFSIANKLGQGVFGTVYRGRLPNDEEIAVKRLSKDSGQGLRKFSNEVQLLAKLQHRNLVKLLGFCLEGRKKFLVYEFMHNSSLDRFSFDPKNGKFLDWQTRIKIITGIARGVLYLHEDSRLKIIHRDLKPSNILLDQEMNPKIADFGLARLVKLDQTLANTSKLIGTYGYMAPEYVKGGVFSIKSDVYSLGVLMLELISGQKPQSNNLLSQNFARDDARDGLITRAWRLWNAGTIIELVDLSLGNGFSRDEALRYIEVGLHCVQEDAASRPTMTSVVRMIDTISYSVTSEFRYCRPEREKDCGGTCA